MGLLKKRTVYSAEIDDKKRFEKTPLKQLCILHRHLANAAHFPISADNREQPLMLPSLETPQLSL